MRKDDMEAGKEQLLQTVDDRAKLVRGLPDDCPRIFLHSSCSINPRLKRILLRCVRYSCAKLCIYRQRIRVPYMTHPVPVAFTP